MFEEKYRADNEQIRLDPEADGRILAALQQEEATPRKEKKTKLWPRLVAAAATVALLTGAAFGMAKLTNSRVNVVRGDLPIATPAPSVTYDDALAVIRALNEKNRQNTRGGWLSSAADGMEVAVNESATAAPNVSDRKSSDYALAGDDTKTNTQYADVDEADVVKTDGQYLYILRQDPGEVAIVRAEGENTRRVGTISLKPEKDKGWSYSNNMYYYNDRLVLLYTESKPIDRENVRQDDARIAIDYWYPTAQVAHAAIYDVSDRTSPKLLKDFGQDGWLTDSRMVDGVLYLCSDHYRYAFREIDEDDVSTFVPSLYDGEKSAPVPESALCVIRDPDNTGYSVLTAVKVSDAPERLSEKAVLGGGGNTLYANSTHLLLGASRWDYEEEVTSLGITRQRHSWHNRTRTVLTLFALNGGDLIQVADGEIGGYLDGQFSIDEYDGYFRIAATSDEGRGSYEEYLLREDWYWDDNKYQSSNDRHNVLYVLDGNLKEVGRVDDLAPDETIRSVRFEGTVGYVVTFRQTDPLFAIDLSDPRKPTVLSALKITGFSEYLHPFGEGRLLGFGQDGTEDGVNGKLKLLMFDTSDQTDVKVKAKQVLPFKDCWSHALYDHHAILPDTSRSLVGLAVQSWDWNGDSRPIYYFLYSYDDETGFEEVARLPVKDADYFGDLRGLFLGEYFYLAGSYGVQVYDGHFELLAKTSF